jgi:hypothetical protein
MGLVGIERDHARAALGQELPVASMLGARSLGIDRASWDVSELAPVQR